MGDLIYPMGVSLDGFISGLEGEIDWPAPDDELFRFHLDRVGSLGARIMGRRLYEVMLVWETSDDWKTDDEREFARVWRALPKVVFSHTLESVEGNARLATGDISAEWERIRHDTDEDVEVGGATLADDFTRLGLIDEYQLFVQPTVIGRGVPYFGKSSERLDLELVETKTFAESVVYLRYRRR